MAEAAVPRAGVAGGQTELVKGLGLFDSTMIVCGSMIGSGIFIVSADIAGQVQSPGLLLIVWIVSGIMTLIGALSYGELAAAMPQAGGQYVYLARIAWADVGISLRLDDAAGDPDGYDRGCGDCVCEIYRRDGAVVFRERTGFGKPGPWARGICGSGRWGPTTSA